MAVVSELTDVKVSLMLNNGISDSGKVKTIKQSLPDIDIDKYDTQKAVNIVNNLKPCLAEDVEETLEIKTSVLSVSN